VAELLAGAQVLLPQLLIGIPDEFIEHGSRDDCLAAAGLDSGSILTRISAFWQKLAGSGSRSAAAGAAH
jgi:1-deoxy-D-xylulose-5-phosphate synthase